jgi:hypothetical protein
LPVLGGEVVASVKRFKLILAAVTASNDVGYGVPGLSEPRLVVDGLGAMG